MSGAAFEWLSYNTQTAYPFDERQADGIHKLFVDAYVIHGKERDKDQRLRISRFDPAGELKLTFEDGAVLTDLTAVDGFATSTFGRFTIYEWRRSSTIGVGFTDEDVVARLVVLTAEIGSFGYPLLPPAGYLLSSLVNPRIARVRRVATASGDLTQACCVGGGFTKDRIVLEAGNNLKISLVQPLEAAGLGIVEMDQTRVPVTVKFDAEGGLGTGRYITCSSVTPPIRRINSVGPDTHGNLQLEGRECLWVERDVIELSTPIGRPGIDHYASVKAALLRLHQDCLACCDCTDYGAAYQKLSEVWHDALSVAARIEMVRQQYNALVEVIKLIKSQKETGLGVRIQTVARPDFHLAVSAIVYNSSEYNLGLTLVRFTLPEAGWEYTAGSGLLDAENLHNVNINPAISGSYLSITLPSLRATKWAIYSFEVRYGPAAGDRAGKTIRPQVTVSSALQTSTAYDVAQLVGPLEKS